MTPEKAKYSPALEAFLAESPMNRPHIGAFLATAAAAISADSRVLDAGAGEAPYRELFSHCRYVTSDWAGSMHAGAASADVIAPIEDLPLDSQSFDEVICTEVLEHLGDPGAGLAELHRLLVPGGRIWVTVPFVWELHEEPHDYFRYTPFGLESLLVKAGFSEVSIDPLTGYFETLGQIVRAYGSITGVTSKSRRHRRGLAQVMARLGLVLGRLDGKDDRRGLPLGYSAVAVKVERG